MKAREILEKLTVSASVKTVNTMLDPKENKDIRIYVSFDIDEALASISKLILEADIMKDEERCDTPLCSPEQLVSHDMAIDAGDPELEGTIFREATYERCGGCPPCVRDQFRAEIRKQLTKLFE